MATIAATTVVIRMRNVCRCFVPVLVYFKFIIESLSSLGGSCSRLMVVVVVLLVLVHLESLLWVSLVMKDHHFAVRVFVRIPTLHMALLVGHFVPLLGILMVARREAKLVAVWSMHALFWWWFLCFFAIMTTPMKVMRRRTTAINGSGMI